MSSKQEMEVEDSPEDLAYQARELIKEQKRDQDRATVMRMIAERRDRLLKQLAAQHRNKEQLYTRYVYRDENSDNPRPPPVVDHPLPLSLTLARPNVRARLNALSVELRGIEEDVEARTGRPYRDARDYENNAVRHQLVSNGIDDLSALLNMENADLDQEHLDLEDLVTDGQLLPPADLPEMERMLWDVQLLGRSLRQIIEHMLYLLNPINYNYRKPNLRKLEYELDQSIEKIQNDFNWIRDFHYRDHQQQLPPGITRKLNTEKMVAQHPTRLALGASLMGSGGGYQQARLKK